MKTLLRIVAGFIALIVVIILVAYIDGATLPVDHSVTVTGVVDAPPDKVFALITNVAAAPTWRHEVQSVQILPPRPSPDGPQDHWIEDLGHHTTMNFIATRTTPVDLNGHAQRDVLLKDPSYGGTWTYLLSPGPSPTQTTLNITERGYINPPIYRFVMAHIFGMTKNLDQYLAEIKTAAAKP